MDNQQNLENEVMQENTCDTPKKFTALKVITAILFALTTIWLVWGILDLVANRPADDSSSDLTGLALAILLIYGTIGYIITFITSLVGTIVSAVNRKNGTSKATLWYFIIFAITTVVCQLVFMIIASTW